MQENARELLTIKEAAQLLGISPMRVWRLVVKYRALPALRVGGRWLVSRRVLERWLDDPRSSMESQ